MTKPSKGSADDCTAVHTQHAILQPCGAKIPLSSGSVKWKTLETGLSWQLWETQQGYKSNETALVSVTATFPAHSPVNQCFVCLRAIKVYNDMKYICNMLEHFTYLSRSSVHCLCGAKQAMAHTLISMPVWNCLFLMSHTPWIGVAIALFCKE